METILHKLEKETFPTDSMLRVRLLEDHKYADVLIGRLSSSITQKIHEAQTRRNSAKRLVRKDGYRKYRPTLMNEISDSVMDRDCSVGIATRSGVPRGVVWGVQTPPPKFRRYRWSPRSHEQEEPVSRFPFVVHCVLIRL